MAKVDAVSDMLEDVSVMSVGAWFVAAASTAETDVKAIVPVPALLVSAVAALCT